MDPIHFTLSFNIIFFFDWRMAIVVQPSVGLVPVPWAPTGLHVARNPSQRNFAVNGSLLCRDFTGPDAQERSALNVGAWWANGGLGMCLAWHDGERSERSISNIAAGPT